ncbi:MAG: D-ribose pyranase [Sediminispirochaetaceae bacterium]
MKRKGILNRQLLELLSTVGHGDRIVITDRGFPIPQNGSTRVIDLGIVPGVPSFADVLFPLFDELIVEGYILAEETFTYNREIIEQVRKHPAITEPEGMTEQIVPHTEFKDMVLSRDPDRVPLTGYIRTGEFTKYTNIILICGVAF